MVENRNGNVDDDSASQHEPQEIINSQTPTVIDEMDTGTQVDDNRYEVERLLGKKNRLTVSYITIANGQMVLRLHGNYSKI